MKNNLKQARTCVKVGAKSPTTQCQTPIHTSLPEYPIISGWLFFQIDFRVFSGNFDIGLFQIRFMQRIGVWQQKTSSQSRSLSLCQLVNK